MIQLFACIISKYLHRLYTFTQGSVYTGSCLKWLAKNKLPSESYMIISAQRDAG